MKKSYEDFVDRLSYFNFEGVCERMKYYGLNAPKAETFQLKTPYSNKKYKKSPAFNGK